MRKTTESTSGRVVRELRAMILAGAVPVGAQLPTEPELGLLFGVGRSSVREAVRVLDAEGFVQTRRGVGAGTFVVVPDTDRISEDLGTRIALLSDVRQISVQHLVDARRALEVPAAGLAAEARTASDLAAMREALQHERGAADQSFDRHSEVHQQILRAAHNDLFRIMAEPVFSVLAGRFTRREAPSRTWRAVHDEHQEILTCIAEQDRAGAEAAMARHLSSMQDLYRGFEDAR